MDRFDIFWYIALSNIFDNDLSVVLLSFIVGGEATGIIRKIRRRFIFILVIVIFLILPQFF